MEGQLQKLFYDLNKCSAYAGSEKLMNETKKKKFKQKIAE